MGGTSAGVEKRISKDLHPPPPPRKLSSLSAHQFAATSIVYFFGLISGVLFSRALGAEGRGRYYVPVTIGSVLFYVASCGTERAQFRTWAHRSGSKTDFVTSAAYLSLMLGTPAAVGAWYGIRYLFPQTFSDGDPVGLALILVTIPIQIHTLLLTGLLFLDDALPSYNRAFVSAALLQMMIAVGMFAAGLLNVRLVLALTAATYLTQWGLMLPRALRIGPIRLTPPWKFMAHQLRVGIQFQPAILFNYLNLRLDVLMLAFYSDARSVGIYSLAITFAELVWLATDSLLVGILERQGNAPEGEAIAVTVKAVRMNLLMAVVIGIAIAITAPPFIRVVYGDAFHDARYAVWSLLPAAAGMAVWRPISATIARMASPRLTSAISLAALVVNIGANAVLIPAAGIVGAGIASGLSYWVGAAGAVYWLTSVNQLRPFNLLPRKEDIMTLARALRPASVRQKLTEIRSSSRP